MSDLKNYEDQPVVVEVNSVHPADVCPQSKLCVRAEPRASHSVFSGAARHESLDLVLQRHSIQRHSICLFARSNSCKKGRRKRDNIKYLEIIM